ncbi:hypothetical protein OG21DRAFT_1519695 [Imleria badia]|nr:hypothetical protein OG21DRAFT_1519695 [Imleria badia]
MSPLEVRPEGNPETINSSEDFSVPKRKRWLQTRFKKNNKDPPPQRDRPSTSVLQSRSQLPSKANVKNERPSIIAEGRRQRTRRYGVFDKPLKRSVAKSIEKTQRKPAAKAAVSSRSVQSPPNPNESNSLTFYQAQPVIDASQPSAKAINVTYERESGKATISFTLPAWMLCFRAVSKTGCIDLVGLMPFIVEFESYVWSLGYSLDGHTLEALWVGGHAEFHPHARRLALDPRGQ